MNKVIEKVIKIITVIVCLAFFFLLTSDVIIKFRTKLTTTGIQFQDDLAPKSVKTKLILFS